MSDDLRDFFSEISKSKKEKKRKLEEAKNELKSIVGDLGLDSLFEDFTNIKKEQIKKEKQQSKKLEAFEDFFSNIEKPKPKKVVKKPIEEVIEKPAKEIVEKPIVTEKEIEEISEEELEKEIEEVKEDVSLIEKSLGLLATTDNNEDSSISLDKKFASFEEFQNHYVTLIQKIQQQLSTLGGGGEVNFKYLDDVTWNGSDDNGKFLKYNSTTEKFEFATVSGGGGGGETTSIIAGDNVTLAGGPTGIVTVGITTEQIQDVVGAMFTNNTETNITATYQDSDGTIDLVASGGGGGGGISLSDLSVTTNSAGSATLAYNNSSGVFTYTPPDLSSYLTTESDTLNSVLGRGNVSGIGISISGTSTFSSDLNVAGALSVAQDITHTGDTNTRITFPPAGDQITFTTNGFDRVGIGSTGYINIGGENERKIDITTGDGDSVLIRPNTGGSNEAGNAGAVNNAIILRAPYGSGAPTTSNAGARLGMVFTGRNDNLGYIDDPKKSAGIYAVSEDPNKGYWRLVGLALYTSPFNSTQTERLRITATGNVGIGTSGPTHKLEVDGNTLLKDNLSVTGISTFTDDLYANGNIIGDNATNISGINSVTATTFFGALTGNVTGNLTGNADTATSSATVTDAAQPNITSLGSLTKLNVTGISTFSKVVNVGVGLTGTAIKIFTTGFQIKNRNDNKFSFAAIPGSHTRLFYNNSNKLETTNEGVLISGISSATSFSGNGAALSGVVTSINAGDNVTLAGGPTGIVTVSANTLYTSYAKISDVKAYNVQGGTAPAGSFNRDINTEDWDPDGIVLGLNGKALSGNLKSNGGNYTQSTNNQEFALGAGTYSVRATSPVHKVNRSHLRLIQVDTDVDRSNTTTIGGGPGVYAHSTVDLTTTFVTLFVRFTITETKIFRVRQFCQTSSTNGYALGMETLATFSPSVYTVVEIYKE
jgi:hypothetical protein